MIEACKLTSRVGLRLSAGHFFIYLGINLLQLIVAVWLGLAVGAVSPTIEIANIIAPFVSIAIQAIMLIRLHQIETPETFV